MATRTAILCALAAALAAGCKRADAPPRAPETILVEAVAPRGGRLAKPVVLEVNGQPLMSDERSLCPLIGDFDGDGLQDLLVGTDVFYTSGRLRIYRNTGAKDNPRFAEPQWFDDLCPTGRIPIG